MRTTLAIDDALLKRAKKAAAERGTSLARLVEDALRESLDKKPPARASWRLPVSRASGGLRPGVDAARNETMWAAVEDEDARR